MGITQDSPLMETKKLPAEFVPQVLLNDDFDQLVDTTGLPDSAPIPNAGVKKVITPPTAGALAVNSPIEVDLPGTSSYFPVRSSFPGKVGKIQVHMTPSPKSAERSISEKPSPDKPNADEKVDYQPSEFGTDTSSDSDLSSEEDMPLLREKTH